MMLLGWNSPPAGNFIKTKNNNPSAILTPWLKMERTSTHIHEQYTNIEAGISHMDTVTATKYISYQVTRFTSVCLP